MSGHDGVGPQAGLINVGGKLYGTARWGGASGLGTIFSFDPSSGAETTVHAFAGGADGASPFGALIKVDGRLFGTTVSGGGGDCDGGCGTVFSFDPSTGAETVVHAFQGHSDSEQPSALLYFGRTLYGTTAGYNYGTVFSIDPATGVETTLHGFKGGADGRQPVGLTRVGSVLYGTTLYGGSSNCSVVGCGVVFKIDPATGHETVVYAFKSGADGAMPSYGDPIEAGGILYGTTVDGGSGGIGTVFSVDPATGGETVLYAFKGGDDGAYPGAGSLTMIGDTLYGVTFRGGGGSAVPCESIGCGTVFSLNLTTGVEQILHAFRGGRAGFPDATLAHVDGRLFGTTAYGGHAAHCNQGCGTVFSLRP